MKILQLKCLNCLHNITNQIQQHGKKIIYHNTVGFIPGIQVQYMQINVILHVNKTKDKSYMILSIDRQNAFDKIHQPFIIKTQQDGYRMNIPQSNEGHI